MRHEECTHQITESFPAHVFCVSEGTDLIISPKLLWSPSPSRISSRRVPRPPPPPSAETDRRDDSSVWIAAAWSVSGRGSGTTTFVRGHVEGDAISATAVKTNRQSLSLSLSSSSSSFFHVCGLSRHMRRRCEVHRQSVSPAPTADSAVELEFPAAVSLGHPARCARVESADCARCNTSVMDDDD